MHSQHYQFSFNCPHCNEPQKVTVSNFGDIDGDTVGDCTKCEKRFVIMWSMELEAAVFKCDNKPAENDNMSIQISGWEDDLPEWEESE
jgi:transcription elongation factor Elf1